MNRHLTIQIIAHTGSETGAAFTAAEELQNRMNSEDADCSVGMSKYPAEFLASRGLNDMPVLTIDGMPWVEGRLPTEDDIQEILSRFYGRGSSSRPEDAEKLIVPTCVCQAADIVLDMLDDKARDLLLRLPDGESIRVLTGKQYTRMMDSFELDRNPVLMAAAGVSNPPAAIGPILAAAKITARAAAEPDDEEARKARLRLEAFDILHRKRIAVFTPQAVIQQFRDVVAEAPGPLNAWWLANLGIEFFTAGEPEMAIVALTRAMSASQALPLRIGAVQIRVKRGDVAGVLDYVKGMSPVGVEYIPFPRKV